MKLIVFTFILSLVTSMAYAENTIFDVAFKNIKVTFQSIQGVESSLGELLLVTGRGEISYEENSVQRHSGQISMQIYIPQFCKEDVIAAMTNKDVRFAVKGRVQNGSYRAIWMQKNTDFSCALLTPYSPRSDR